MVCPICGSKPALWRYHGQTPILRCTDRKCGFRFFDLARWQPPHANADYYAEWRPAPVAESLPWIRDRVDTVQRLKPHGALAELGCGIGETAIAFQKAGYQVAAVEESEKAISFLRRHYPAIDWHNGDVLNFLASRRDAFDIVTMYHVLEHIPYPKHAVEQMVRALRPNGLIVVEVPDTSGGWARLKGPRWEYYLDHHVNYFDLKSLQRLFAGQGYCLAAVRKNYHFSYPQGDVVKDLVKGTLGRIGLNSIIRTAWIAERA